MPELRVLLHCCTLPVSLQTKSSLEAVKTSREAARKQEKTSGHHWTRITLSYRLAFRHSLGSGVNRVMDARSRICSLGSD